MELPLKSTFPLSFDMMRSLLTRSATPADITSLNLMPSTIVIADE